MKKLALLFVCIFAFQLAVFADDDKPVTFEQLPQVAQQFIGKHFAGKTISLAKIEGGILEKSYDVIFSDGNKLEFDRKGQWTDIDCKYSEVPESVVPQQIADYVAVKHKGVKILKIEREKGRYDVDLSNGWELTFDKKFNVVDIDR
jgi:hypothetical protein